MELRPLVDVELREVLSPINRAARGEFVPALRTVAQLRERVAGGLLDLTLSRACFVAGAIGGTCLVERLADENIAHIEALASEPLAQQRGALRALIEAVQGAAADGGVTELSIFVSEMDSALLPALQAAGFSRRQLVGRYTLNGAPASLPLPVEVDEAVPLPAAASWVRRTSLADIASLLSQHAGPAVVFSSRVPVLARLSDRLTALALYATVASGDSATTQPALVAAVVFDRERKLLCALAGQTDALASLICLAATRHGVAHIDAIGDVHPAVAALLAAGFSRTTVRVEMACEPRTALLLQRQNPKETSAPEQKGTE